MKAPRLRRLGKGSIIIFTTGLQAAATFGAEVVGVNNMELKHLRDIAAQAMQPATRGRCRAALFVMKGDPTWRPSIAPLIRWAQEVWWTSVPKSGIVPCLASTLFHRAWANLRRAPPKGWGQVRGAVDAAYLSARRIGWTIVDPFTFQTDLGAKLPLRETAPALVTKMLQQALQRSWQRKMATSLRKKCWMCSRVCPDPITATTYKWATTYKKEACAAAKCFCDAIWTPCRARESGYVLEDL